MNRWIVKLMTSVMATCQETSEGASDLIEGTLSDKQRGRIRRHLTICGACRAYKAQMETGVRVLHELPKEEITAPEKDALLKRFREKKP